MGTEGNSAADHQPSSIEQMTLALGLVSRELHEYTAAIEVTRRQQRLRNRLIAAGLLIGILLLLLGWRGITAFGKQAELNGRIYGCTISVALGHNPEACKEVKQFLDDAGIPTTADSNAAAQRSIEEGRRRTVEVDCLHRRTHAGMSAPDPMKPCIDQTPPNVYPGTP